MRAQEITRVREQGTVVTNPKMSIDPGMARIAAIRNIVKESQYAKVDGIMVDLFSASAIVKVYDAINDENKVKFRNLPTAKMASIAFKLMH